MPYSVWILASFFLGAALSFALPLNTNFPLNVTLPLTPSRVSLSGLLANQTHKLKIGRRQNQGRVVNGVRAAHRPFMVAISLSKWGFSGKYLQHICGGTIINDDSILTAAHCLFAGTSMINADDVFISVGNDQGHITFEEDKLFQARTFFYNQEYGDELYNTGRFPMEQGGDVAIIKLARRINFDDFGGSVKAVCLPSVDLMPSLKNCYVLGWGQIGEEAPPSPVLLRARVPIVSPSVCSEYNGPFEARQLICAGYMGGGSTSCYGDSGGPLVCLVRGTSNVFLQFGIVSWGKYCGGSGSFYQKTKPWIDWIRNVAEQY